MATHLITPNEAAGGSPGDETNVLLFGGRSSPLIIVNPLISKLFEEVTEGVRALPRGGAEIGGLLVGPKGHEGGVLANEIIPIPIEYRFGPSFRLSSPDLTKVEEMIASVHKDPAKTVVGFYRSRTRGNAELRESDQEILLAVEMAHTAFATDFHFYGVLSPPAKSEMALALAIRKGDDWSDFRPFTCHLNPLSVTSDLGDPEPEPMETPIEAEAPALNLETELTHSGADEFVDAQMEALNGNGHEPAMSEPEALNGDGHEPVIAETDAVNDQNPELALAEPETMNQESLTVETEALPSDVHEPANADMETLNGDGHLLANEATETAPKAARKKAKAQPKSETAAKPRAKKTTTTAKPKKGSTAAAGSASRASHAEPKVKPTAPAAAPAAATAPAMVIEPKPMPKAKPAPDAEYMVMMRTDAYRSQWSRLAARISRKHLWWAAGVVVVAALATGGYFYLNMKPAPPAAQPTHAAAASPATKQPLALTAERHGTDLVLSWNRDSPSISRASYGMLIIKGKDGRRDIALTPDQLRAGSIVYTPTTDQVEVELSVVAGEQVTKDSVIVFLPHKGDKNAIVTTAQTQDTPQSPAAPQASSAQLNERERPKGPFASPPGRENLRPFSMPATPAGPETAGLLHLEEPPLSLNQRPVPASVVASLPGPQLPSVPPAPAPAPEVAAAQIKTPNKPAPAPSVILPAVATEQVLPHFPENMKALVTSPRLIEVTVSIDETGKVVKAEAAPQNHSDPLLVGAALEAARRWKFRPATINSKPIASEMIVKFNFAPVK